MSPLWPDLACVRLKLADEAFGAGEMLRHGKSLRSAVNRYYYATFYAARALLALEGFDESRHGAIIGEFRRRFVKTGVISPAASDAVGKLFDERTEGDYQDDKSFSIGEVDDLAALSRAFIDEIREVLQQRGVMS